MDRLATITIKPSRITFRLHLTVLFLALTALLLCGMNWLIKIPLALGLLTIGIWLLQTQILTDIQKIGFEQERWWVVINGNKTGVELLGEQLVLPWLIVINLRVDDSRQKHSLVLWKDSADKDDLRRLRVFLRNL